MYNVHVVEGRGFESHLRQLIFLWKSDCLWCAVLLHVPCFVCLTLLASFFLPSHLSLKHVYCGVSYELRLYICACTCTCTCMCIRIYICTYTCISYLYSLYCRVKQSCSLAIWTQSSCSAMPSGCMSVDGLEIGERL